MPGTGPEVEVPGTGPEVEVPGTSPKVEVPGTCPEVEVPGTGLDVPGTRAKSRGEGRRLAGWAYLRHRLRRWWTQDEIRLSKANFVTETLRVGDRLQIENRELRLIRRIDLSARFEARDEEDLPWTVEQRRDSYHFEPAEGEPLSLPNQVVLVVPVSRLHPPLRHSATQHKKN